MKDTSLDVKVEQNFSLQIIVGILNYFSVNI